MKRTQAVTEFRAIDRMTKPIINMAREAENASRRMSNSFKRVNRHVTALNSHLNRMTGTLGRFAPALGLLSAGGLFYAGREVVDAAATYESLATSIRFASGSIEEGDRNMQFLRKTSKDLKVDFMSAAEGFKMFSANFIGQGVSASEQRDMFTGVSKAIRVMGLDSEKTISVYRALGEIVSKGTLMAQELKLQLANAMPGTTQAFATALGYKNVASMYKDMEKGAINGLHAVRAYAKHADKIYSKGIPDAIKTTSSALTDLNNEILFFKIDVGNMLVDTGIIQHITNAVKGMKEWVDANKEMLGQRMKQAVDWIVDVGRFIMDNGSEIITLLKGLAGAFVVLKTASAISSVFMALGNPIGWAIIAIAALSVVLIDAAFNMEDFRRKAADTKSTLDEYETLVSVFNNIGGAISSLFQLDGWGMLKKAIAGVVQFVALLVEGIYDLVGIIVSLFSGGKYTYMFEAGDDIRKQMNEWVDPWANPEDYVPTAVKESPYNVDTGKFDKNPVQEEVMKYIASIGNKDGNKAPFNLYVSQGLEISTEAPAGSGFDFINRNFATGK